MKSEQNETNSEHRVTNHSAALSRVVNEPCGVLNVNKDRSERRKPGRERISSENVYSIQFLSGQLMICEYERIYRDKTRLFLGFIFAAIVGMSK